MQRIPESSCARKETVDIDILVTSATCDRKIIQSIRITSRPPTRIRKWNQLRQFRWTSTKVIHIGSFQPRSPKAVNEGSSVSLKFSPFVSINEISISWKFQLHTYYQTIFVAIWNFWLLPKNCKIWFGPILEVNFWKIEFLEVCSSNFPWS